MSDQELCDLLNEFYEDIRPDLVDSVFLAIKAANNANEFVLRTEVFDSLHRLILNLANPQQDDGIAINTYMADNNTRGSSTRPFFYHMTLPGNLNPEDISQNVHPLPPSREQDFFRHRAEDFLSQPDEPVTFFPPPLPPLGRNLTSLALFQT